MNERTYKFIFEGVNNLGNVETELQELNKLLREQQLINEENARKARDAANARKAASDAAKKAAIDQINAELGITNALNSQAGLIEKLRDRIKTLRAAREQANDVQSINLYNRALADSTQELNRLTAQTDRFRGSNGFWQDLKGQVLAVFATQQIYDFGKALLSNEVKLESSRLALKNVITDSNQYAQSLEFLDTISNKYGQDISILTDTYKNFIAASQSSGLELKERNRIYESIVKAGSALRLSNEEIEGSLRAVSQMFSKGNVQAEELRGQLGERLPGAFGLAAKAMGVTEEKLNDMLKAGDVLAVDLLPKLATELDKAFGDKAVNNVNSVGGAFNRVTNTVKEWFGEINKGLGITTSFAKGLNFLADNFDKIVQVGKGVLTFFASYILALKSTEIWTKGVAVAQTAWLAIEKTALVIKGEWILLTKSQQVATLNLSVAELEAAIAADTLNKALLRNPWGLLIALVGTAIVAYQAFATENERVATEQEKLKKSISDAIIPLKVQQVEFNKLASEVLNSKKSIEEKNKALDELKKRFPVQLAGITDLKDAERKLGEVIRDTNADFLIRGKLLENEVRTNVNKERQTKILVEQIELERQLGNIQRAISNGTAQSFLAAAKVKEQELINDLNRTKRLVANFNQANDNIAEQSTRITKQLKFEYDKREKDSSTHSENNKKEKIDSAKTLALIEDKANIDSLEKTRETALKALALQLAIDTQRIEDSKASTAKKNAEIKKLEEKFRSDSYQLTQKWNEKEEDTEKVSAAYINKIRADFRALNYKDEKKSLEQQIKAIEAKYKEEIDLINKSSKSYNDKKVKVAELVIQEEKEILLIKNQIEFLKVLDALHKEQSKNIQKITKDILEKWNIQDKIDAEEIEHQKELIKLYQERQQQFGDMISSLVPEVKGLMEYNQALENSGRAIVNLADERLKLSKIEKDSGIQSAEFAKQLEITNKAQEASVKATTAEMVSQYQLLYKAIEIVFNAVKNTISKSFRDIANAFLQANKIYQDFAKQQRDAEIAAYKTDLDYRLDLLEGNFDAQIDLLKDYFKEADAVIARINLADDIANELQATTNKIVGFTTYVADEMDKFSLNPFTNIKNAFGQLGMAIAGWKKENTDAAQSAIVNAQNTIENLKWQRDQSISLLDEIAEKYKDKYDEMLDKVKDGLSKQVDAIKDSMGKQVDAAKAGLDKMLDNLSNWYDAQRDLISDKYDAIIENKTRLDDKYFDGYLSKQEGARKASEDIAEADKNGQIAILKKQYEDGTITLAEYISKTQTIESEFLAKRLADRTTHYSNLRLAATDATNKEIDDLKTALKDGKITQEQYDTDLGIIQERGKQRQIDINGVIKADRDGDLKDLKDNYLDQKVLAEEDTAKKIEKIRFDSGKAIEKAEKESGDEIIRITQERDAKLAELAKQRRDTELQYNSDIFEQNRALANAQAVVALAEAKANAWKNPFTANAVIRQIQDAFAEIFAQIGSAVNPFARDIVGNTAQDDKNKPVDQPNDPGIGGGVGSFAKGTPRLPNMNGKSGIDTQPAMLNIGERITSTFENDVLRNAFGTDISNRELITRAISTLPRIDYSLTNNLKNVSTTGIDPKLLSVMQGIESKIGNLKQVNVNVENGYTNLETYTAMQKIKLKGFRKINV